MPETKSTPSESNKEPNSSEKGLSMRESVFSRIRGIYRDIFSRPKSEPTPSTPPEAHTSRPLSMKGLIAEGKKAYKEDPEGTEADMAELIALGRQGRDKEGSEEAPDAAIPQGITGLEAFEEALDAHETADQYEQEVGLLFQLLRQSRFPGRKTLLHDLGLDAANIKAVLAEIFDQSEAKIMDWVRGEREPIEIIFTELLAQDARAHTNEIRILELIREVKPYKKLHAFFEEHDEFLKEIFTVLMNPENADKTLHQLRKENALFADSFPKEPETILFELQDNRPDVQKNPFESPELREAMSDLRDWRILLASENETSAATNLAEKLVKYDEDMTLIAAFTEDITTPIHTLIKKIYDLKNNQKVADKIIEIHTALSE